MYLKRVTLAGFKSFATRTVIELEPGITAIVGPNGSGKSNVTDAVRWAMGEQNRSRLRLADREEVIFAGSDGRARASMAEVGLVFDNSSGRLPIEASEIELSRRLYRSGEADYFIMGRPAKLAEVQLLLAQAQVGAGSYAVVGQGMVDQLVMGSPAERRALFDEASGIRADEIKRDASLRQLNRTQQNVQQLRTILAELSDRLGGLERVAASGRRIESDRETLSELRQRWVDATYLELQQNEHELHTAEKRHIEEMAKLKTATAELAKRQAAHLAARKAIHAQREQLQRELAELEHSTGELMAGRIQLEAQLQRQPELETDREAVASRAKVLSSELTKSAKQRRSMQQELTELAAAVARSEKELARLAEPVKEAQAALLELRRSQEEGSQQQYIDHALSTLKLVAQNLVEEVPPLEQVRLLVHKTGRLLSHAAKKAGPDLVAELEAARVKLERAMARRETVVDHLANLALSQRSKELELSHLDELVGSREVELERVNERLERIKAELDRVKAAQKELQAGEGSMHSQRERLERLRASIVAGDEAEGGTALEVELALEVERLDRRRENLEASKTELATRKQVMKREGERVTKQAKAYDLEPRTKPVKDDAGQLEREIALLEARLAAEEETYTAGATEEREVRERYEELSTQMSDLESAEGNLRSVIERLDEAIRANFNEGFGRIAEAFARYFAELFEGGKASLALEVDENNQYGIEMKASAKGKRLTGIAAMSGGERAMTGVALLAAIIETTDSPFVILDEVDAALDEANSAKFAAILERLSERTQLVVVTHNHQTMTAAPVLYGVTIGPGHSSHLLSLRLEQAQALAAR